MEELTILVQLLAIEEAILKVKTTATIILAEDQAQQRPTEVITITTAVHHELTLLAHPVHITAAAVEA